MPTSISSFTELAHFTLSRCSPPEVPAFLASLVKLRGIEWRAGSADSAEDAMATVTAAMALLQLERSAKTASVTFKMSAWTISR